MYMCVMVVVHKEKVASSCINTKMVDYREYTSN